jgi:glutamyl-tRNA reductase
MSSTETSANGRADLLLLGVNHRSAPLERREALALGTDEMHHAVRRLAPDIGEVALLSTCNRTEFYAFSNDLEATETRLRAEVIALRGEDLLAPGTHRYRELGPAALAHLMRVASGIDSLVLGEMQILGQVKDAYALAREEHGLGVRMDKLLGAVVHAAKRARSETGIGAGAVSVASAAVALAARVFDDLAGRDVLVVGAGETGRLAAQHFAERRPGRLRIANRTLERAQALAAELDGDALPLEGLGGALMSVDVVVSATAAPEPIITEQLVRRAMKPRANRPLVLVDIAVPRDVEANAARCDNVFLYAMDALETIVNQGLSRRQREVPAVEAIIEQECTDYFAWLRGLDATPVLRELRDHFERTRAEEVGKSLKHFSGEERDRVERLTKTLINKLLHLPTMQLKTLDSESDVGIKRLDVVRELFGLKGQVDEEREAGSGS